MTVSNDCSAPFSTLISGTTQTIYFDLGGTAPITKTLNANQDYDVVETDRASPTWLDLLGYDRFNQVETLPNYETSAKGRRIKTGNVITPSPQEFEFRLRGQTDQQVREWYAIQQRNKDQNIPVVLADQLLSVHVPNPRTRAKVGPFITENDLGMDHYWGVFHLDIIHETFMVLPMTISQDEAERTYFVRFSGLERILAAGVQPDLP